MIRVLRFVAAAKRAAYKRAMRPLFSGGTFKENQMILLAQYGRFALITLGMLARRITVKLDHFPNGNRVWVTGHTGNATVITDKIL